MGQPLCAEQSYDKIQKQNLIKKGLQIRPEISEQESEAQKYAENNYSGDIKILLYEITDYQKKPLKIKYFRNNFNKGLLLKQVHFIYPKSYVYYFDEQNTFKCLNDENPGAKIYDILYNRNDFQQLGANKFPQLYISCDKAQDLKNQDDEIRKKIQECRDYIKELRNKAKLIDKI
ncbi:hypothetical protein ABPG72_014260 [Tetrahymena utriculariae]